MSAEIRTLTSASSAASVGLATVRDASDGCFLVEMDGKSRKAHKAFGCLVRPQPGDVVLVASSARGLDILSVLERPEEHRDRTLLDLPGNTLIRVPDTSELDIQGGKSLSLRSGARLQQSAPEFDLQGQRLGLKFEQVRSVCRDFLATLNKSRLVCNLYDLVTSTRRLFARHSERHVEGLDATHAANVHVKTDQVMHVQGETLLSTAKKLYRVDGDQIHLG